MERHTFVQAVLWVPNSNKARLTAETFVRKYGRNHLRVPGISGNRLSSATLAIVGGSMLRLIC